MTVQTDDWKGEHLIRAPKREPEEVEKPVDEMNSRQRREKERLERELAMLRAYEGKYKTAVEISKDTGIATDRISKLKSKYNLKLLDMRLYQKLMGK